MRKVYSLVIVRKDGNVLLGEKKTGFGQGFFNGFGGKVEEGESIEQAAVRELQEEAGLKANTIVSRGAINFNYMGDDRVHEVHIFECTDYSGEPVETDEMRPQWFDGQNVPYDSMWPNDKIWMPIFMEGRDVSGTFNLGPDKEVVSHTLNEIKVD